MPGIAIVTDSTSDLTPEELVALNAIMVPLNVHFGSEVYRDHLDLTPPEFLAKLASSTEMPRTSQPSPAAFTEAIDRALQTSDQVLVITLSSKLSGTYQSAVLGAGSSTAPERVHVFDSLSASIGLGMQVRRARALVDEGLGIDQVLERLADERGRYHLIFFADTLEYLQRGGRIGKASQLLGSILKIKPLLLCQDGEVVPFERTRNRSRAVDGIIDYALGFPAIDELSILHDDSHPKDIERIRTALAAVFPADRIIPSLYGPIVATHVGAGAMGLCLREGGGTA